MSKSSQVEFLIVGGGVAGTTAAETIRARSEGRIMIVTDDRHTLYSKVRLPDYIAGKIPREKVFLKDESWYREKGIDLLREVSVETLSLKEQSAYLSNGMTIQYDKLLLATGGFARRLRCPGFELDGIYYLRTIEDAECIQQAIRTAKKAVVIGGGFIGLELARCFLQGGLETAMVMMEPQFWPSALDKESAKMIEDLLHQKGVMIHYSDQVKEFWGNSHVQRVLLASGKSYGCEMVGMGIGIDTLPPFIKTSGLLWKRGILTDECLRTSDFYVFAAGDVAEFYDVDRSHPHQIGNWSNATEQGKVAGSNMVGERNIFKSVSSYVIRIFGLSVGFVGNTTLMPGTQVIRRGSASDGDYVRLFIRNGVVKGATLMNRTHEIRPIMELIKRAVKIERYRSNLSDLEYDLESFLASDFQQGAPAH
jgi:NAD(P)H-nitrite reductase large subunit